MQVITLTNSLFDRQVANIVVALFIKEISLTSNISVFYIGQIISSKSLQVMKAHKDEERTRYLAFYMSLCGRKTIWLFV